MPPCQTLPIGAEAPLSAERALGGSLGGSPANAFATSMQRTPRERALRVQRQRRKRAVQCSAEHSAESNTLAEPDPKSGVRRVYRVPPLSRGSSESTGGFGDPGVRAAGELRELAAKRFQRLDVHRQE